MSWGTKRRNLILVVIFFLFIIPIGVIAFLILYKPPTCFDGIQNGEESGVDCGGMCVLLCTDQMAEPVVLWERAFRFTGGLHNLIAYVQNQNPNGFIKNANYVFKIYNEENILIQEVTGTVSIPPKTSMPIIQTGVQLFEQVVSRITFEFTNNFVFEKSDPRETLLLIKDEVVENEDTAPRIRAKVQNVSFNTVSNVDIIVIVYDSFDSVIGVSSTFVPMLQSEQTQDIVFTWQIPFTDRVSRVEIIPLYDNK
jgi:hypothetical protein